MHPRGWYNRFTMCKHQLTLVVGCSYAQEASFITKTNDPEGFNIIDLLAYGSLGHALGFFLLACSSLGTKPIPF